VWRFSHIKARIELASSSGSERGQVARKPGRTHRPARAVCRPGYTQPMKYIGLLSSAASGKLGGIVASHNRGGTYFRHHAVPVQPRTPAQTLVRNQLQGFSSAFKSLTPGADCRMERARPHGHAQVETRHDVQPHRAAAFRELQQAPGRD